MQLSLPFSYAVSLLLLGCLVSALPTPGFAEGDVVRARPKHWGDSNKKAGNHFGVVVGFNKDANKYLIAHTSHNLPTDRYPHQHSGTNYHPKFDQAAINVGKPVEVAEEHLSSAKAIDQNWTKVDDKKLAALKAEIKKNCPDSGLTRRNGRCVPKSKATPKKGAAPVAKASHGKARKPANKPSPKAAASGALKGKPGKPVNKPAPKAKGKSGKPVNKPAPKTVAKAALKGKSGKSYKPAQKIGGARVAAKKRPAGRTGKGAKH